MFSVTTLIDLRPPEQVMRPEWFGAVRLTRYSFNRMLIRRAFRERWRVNTTLVDLDGEGRGEVRYEVVIGSRVFTFVAFTTRLDEADHTDRVVADRWEVTAALCEGKIDDGLAALLSSEVPKQEQGRLDQRVLVLTRGNRSVRFFDYLVDTLAVGGKPDPEMVGDAGYIMRSTAFYGNGAFGIRSFASYDADHPLAAPFRAQFLCAWLFRELSYEVVEHCARHRGGDRAVGFDEDWRRFFGLGNATGLGLVPYAFKHPAIIDAWVQVREKALAEVRQSPGNQTMFDLLRTWLDRAGTHFATGADDDCSPFLNGASLRPVVAEIAAAFERCHSASRPFDALYRWAEGQDQETAELVVSLLLELHEGDDAAIAADLLVEENTVLDPATTVAELQDCLATNYGWLDSLDLESPDANEFWWLITDNNNEPRRARREALKPQGRDVPVDVALRLRRLRTALAHRPADEAIHLLLCDQPEHRFAADRLASHHRYGEPLDNACDQGYLPLMVQRFQLAMYGMDNFKPKSTDWLRVTLFQGAPRIADLADPSPSPELVDRWVWPPRPSTTSNGVQP